MMAFQWTVAVEVILVVLSLTATSSLRLGIPRSLRIVSRRVATTNFDDVDVAQVGPKFGEFAIGGGLIAYRSSVIASLSQLDRGEKEAAMESLRVAIASLALETTKTYGLPVVSVVMDKIIKNYGAKFPKTINGFKSYNEMLGNSILNQVEDVASPLAVDESDEVLDSLDTLKKQIQSDFGDEVTSYLKSTTAHDDLVKSLKHVKTWAKVVKWGDFLLGPIFDVAMIGFTGWQLHGAIQSGDELSIASGSLSIAASVVGVTSFVVSCLATTGTVLAATAGPIGAIIGCVLSLAALIIDVINLYNPEQAISKHLEIVKSLTSSSKNMLENLHTKVLQKASADRVDAGFNTLYEVNQAMLVKASISDHWDTIKGFKSDRQMRIEFKPDIVREDGDLLVVGNMRVFDQKHYQNWAFKPEGREEVGYNYYGKVLNEDVGGLFVRLDTEMITNNEDNLWFWLNGAKVTTFSEGQQDQVADDNVHIGDFRTLLSSSGRFLDINTGGGNDLLQISGIICSEEQQKLLQGRCLIADMGDGYDTISFNGMDTRIEKRKWLMKHDDLEQTKFVVGIVFDMGNKWISYKLKDNDGKVSNERFAGVNNVERFIGSPLNDIVKFNNDRDYAIKEFSGENIYDLEAGLHSDKRQHVIEDDADIPGKLIIRKDGIGWRNILYCKSTNVILIAFSKNNATQIILKRSKPGLDDFKVQLNHGSAKKISEIEAVDVYTDFVFPLVPYPYKFDRNLMTTYDQVTFIELWAPENTYPDAVVSYKMEFSHANNILILTEDLLKFVKQNSYMLIARRKGVPQSSNSWHLMLTKRGESGGWRVNIGQTGVFATGQPGSFRLICNLAEQERSEVDIFIEHQKNLAPKDYDFTEDFYGTDDPDELIFIHPKGLQRRQGVDEYTVDLKGPVTPTRTARNELVVSDRFINEYFKRRRRLQIRMEVERKSVDQDWHLKLYSGFGAIFRLRVDVTLKGVHVIVTGNGHGRIEVLDLNGSQELLHDLDDLLDRAVGRKYSRW